jgi:acyl dehydratase
LASTNFAGRCRCIPGDELHLESHILEEHPSKSRSNHGLIKLRTTTRNQDGEAVQVSVGSLIVPRRPSSHTDSPSPDNQP